MLQELQWQLDAVQKQLDTDAELWQIEQERYAVGIAYHLRQKLQVKHTEETVRLEAEHKEVKKVWGMRLEDVMRNQRKELRLLKKRHKKQLQKHRQHLHPLMKQQAAAEMKLRAQHADKVVELTRRILQSNESAKIGLECRLEKLRADQNAAMRRLQHQHSLYLVAKTGYVQAGHAQAEAAMEAKHQLQLQHHHTKNSWDSVSPTLLEEEKQLAAKHNKEKQELEAAITNQQGDAAPLPFPEDQQTEQHRLQERAQQLQLCLAELQPEGLSHPVLN